MKSKLFLLLTLCCLCVLTSYSQSPDSLTRDIKKEVIRNLEKQLIDNYIFADTARQMAALLERKLAADAYDSIQDAQNFGKTLSDDVRSVYRDLHFSVRYSPQMAIDMVKLNPADSAEDNRKQLEDGRRLRFGWDTVKIKSGNIGYIKLDGFWDIGTESKHTTDSSMAIVANCKALIFDLRENRGGDPAMVSYLCGFLFEKKTHVNDLFERRINKTTPFWTEPNAGNSNLFSVPIYILTSAKTFSAGEEFSYDLQTQKRGLVIGEATGGGAHPLDFFLPGHGFVAAIPVARAINPITKTNWEGRGVVPDRLIAPEKALDLAMSLAQ